VIRRNNEAQTASETNSTNDVGPTPDQARYQGIKADTIDPMIWITAASLNFSYRLMRAIYPVFRALFPNQVIRADDLARAMVDVVVRRNGAPGNSVFENRDIRAMVESLHTPAG